MGNRWFRWYPYKNLNQMGKYSSPSDWSLQDGYRQKNATYPLRLYGGKYIGDFEFSINIFTENIENICNELPSTLVSLKCGMIPFQFNIKNVIKT